MDVVQLSQADRGRNGFMALANLDQAAIDALPQAVYICAADGRVIRFNEKAASLWGRTPDLADASEKFCGSLRLYRTDGTFVPHDECPMATALQTGEPVENQEIMVERPDGRRLTVLVNIAALRDEQGRVNGAVNAFQDVSDRKRSEERQHQLIKELNHRIKNTFANILSVAWNTGRDATSIGDFNARFEARLMALSRTHALFDDDGTGAPLRDLLAQQFEPFGGEETARVRFEGPEVELPPQMAVPLSMVVHELITNAAKYGPLSVAGGRISIEWELVPASEGDRTLAFRWTEMDGPPVEAPQRKGFGTRLIKRMIRAGLGGQADLSFDPAGLRLTATIPLPG